jgi:hypothetical protein
VTSTIIGSGASFSSLYNPPIDIQNIAQARLSKAMREKMVWRGHFSDDKKHMVEKNHREALADMETVERFLFEMRAQ